MLAKHETMDHTQIQLLQFGSPNHDASSSTLNTQVYSYIFTVVIFFTSELWQGINKKDYVTATAYDIDLL